MRKKRIALVFGMEYTFPWALIDAINTRGGDEVDAMPAEISYLKDDGVFPYDLILDRISHEITFYRTYLNCAAASGVPGCMVAQIVALRDALSQGRAAMRQGDGQSAAASALRKSPLPPGRVRKNPAQRRTFGGRFVHGEKGR